MTARLLGIFEDVAFRDFVSGVIDRLSMERRTSVEIQPFLTGGCSFANLRLHFEKLDDHDGVLVGVDGGRASVREKRRRLQQEIGVGDAFSRPLLWAIASPSVEAWLMADPEAVYRVLADRYGVHAVRREQRPKQPRSEAAAKTALREWTKAIVGRPLLRRGCEHATEIGRQTDPHRVGPGRDAALSGLLLRELPAFLDACRS